VLSRSRVGYRFTKSWTDADSGARQEWVSHAPQRSKMEVLEFDADERITYVGIEVYEQWPPFVSV
jgi:hypothetical protein